MIFRHKYGCSIGILMLNQYEGFIALLRQRHFIDIATATPLFERNKDISGMLKIKYILDHFYIYVLCDDFVFINNALRHLQVIGTTKIVRWFIFSRSLTAGQSDYVKQFPRDSAKLPLKWPSQWIQTVIFLQPFSIHWPFCNCTAHHHCTVFGIGLTSCRHNLKFPFFLVKK